MSLIKENFLVASDYNWLPDDITESWIHKYTDNYLIYDRAHRLEESDKVKHQKNVGQNIYDMFDFIATHYDNLPETTIFCRACILFPKVTPEGQSYGNCSEEKFVSVMNNKTFTELHDFGPEVHNGVSSKMGPNGGFLEINNSWYMHHFPCKYFNNLNTFLRHVYVNPEIPEYIRFAPGGNYIIPRENILRYSKNFYEKIREYLGWECLVGEAHLLERALYTIFTCDYDVRDEYK
jgi:hypothetical protein